VQFELRDSGDLKRLVRALKDVEDGKALKRELSQGLRGVVAPLVPEVRQAYLHGGIRARRRHGAAEPTTHHPGDLRRSLAKATRAEVRTTGRLAGARVRVDGRRMPPRQGSLPAMYEGVKRWRHPVFGDRGTWAQNQPRPTFYPLMHGREDDARRAIGEVVAGVFRKIERQV
jgi:hypothetical protein